MLDTSPRPLAAGARLAALLLLGSCAPQPVPQAPAAAPQEGGESPPLSVDQAMATFSLPPGYRLELVASEPMVSDPVAIDFDADGYLYVVEMRGYMRTLSGEGEAEPVGQVVRLQDRNGDGRMDHRTVFLDSLVMPRAVKATRAGVLVGAPPYLLLATDTDGDGRADQRRVLRDDYGQAGANPEHTANGLHWGIDNWIHNSDHDAQYRLRGGELEVRSTANVGQWGVASDDWGRLYRNANESPLHVDLVPAHWYARGPAQPSRGGVYERVTPNGPVWPAGPTPGVNRGYRERTLRADSTLAHFTAAANPVPFRGDQLPKELVGDVFVAEPAGNLVRRYAIRESAEGRITATNAYEQREFIASTDERFRPVSLHSAPDGTLYVVDMYRGIIQHRYYITDYLAQQIRARKLEQPIGMGRIYRVVHESTRRAPRPQLSRSSSAQLVEQLTHSNGWWRQAAQQLLVERGDRTAAPRLERLLRETRDPRARLHALWTLDGLDALAEPALVAAARDESPHLRAAAARIAGTRLRAGSPQVTAALLAMARDPDPRVRWHAAGSLAALPPAEQVGAVADLLTRHPDDAILADVALSGMGVDRAELARRLLRGGAPSGLLARVTAAVVRGGEAAGLAGLLQGISDADRPAAERVAMLQAIAAAAQVEGGRGGETRTLSVPAEPTPIIAATRDPERAVRDAALTALGSLTWPGKPSAAGGGATLTAAEAARFAEGGEVYARVCAGCHQANGEGMPGLARPLAGSPWAQAPSGHAIRIVLHGKEGEMLMPPMGGALSDAEVAAVLTYVRRSWGNDASPIAPEEVEEVRGYTGARSEPWTEEELRQIRRR